MRTNIKSIVIGSLAAVGLIGALSAYKSCNDTSNDTILSEIEYMREKKERKENTLTSLGAAKFIDGEISPWSSTVINLNYVTPENDTVRVTLNDNAEDGFLKNNDQEPEQVSIGSPNRSQYFDDLIFCGSGSSCDNNVSDLPISLVERLVADARRVESTNVDQPIPIYSSFTDTTHDNIRVYFVNDNDSFYIDSTGVHKGTLGQLPPIASQVRKLAELVEKEGRVVNDVNQIGHEKEMEFKIGNTTYTVKLSNSNEHNLTAIEGSLGYSFAIFGANNIGDRLFLTESRPGRVEREYQDRFLKGNVSCYLQDGRVLSREHLSEPVQARIRANYHSAVNTILAQTGGN